MTHSLVSWGCLKKSSFGFFQRQNQCQAPHTYCCHLNLQYFIAAHLSWVTLWWAQRWRPLVLWLNWWCTEWTAAAPGPATSSWSRPVWPWKCRFHRLNCSSGWRSQRAAPESSTPLTQSLKSPLTSRGELQAWFLEERRFECQHKDGWKSWAQAAVVSEEEMNVPAVMEMTRKPMMDGSSPGYDDRSIITL